MSDKKKVIEGLEWILEDDRFGFGVNWRTGEPRDEYEKAGKIITDTITLLKEQKVVEPEVEVLNEIDRLYRCPKCHKCFFYEKQKYCDQCGQAVKWNE